MSYRNQSQYLRQQEAKHREAGEDFFAELMRDEARRAEWVDRAINAISHGHVIAVPEKYAETAVAETREVGYSCHSYRVGNAVPRIEIKRGEPPERGPEPVPDNPGEPTPPTNTAGI